MGLTVQFRILNSLPKQQTKELRSQPTKMNGSWSSLYQSSVAVKPGFVLDLVGNPKDTFSRDAAHVCTSVIFFKCAAGHLV